MAMDDYFLREKQIASFQRLNWILSLYDRQLDQQIMDLSQKTKCTLRPLFFLQLVHF